MSYNLSDKLVIGLSSSALFDLEESDNVFRQNGEEEYRVFQRENQDNTLKKGVAFPFIGTVGIYIAICSYPFWCY
ncbi:5'-nucleotidase [Brenneria sp. g21c3]|uniref:5'-nucleotidase n=1 Tax=Brenneria sp. g21c3 TaxID=3093893 RepID=UPI002EB928EF|nr:5'-nucleotidase [Brenneria sp. g21c3]